MRRPSMVPTRTEYTIVVAKEEDRSLGRGMDRLEQRLPRKGIADKAPECRLYRIMM